MNAIPSTFKALPAPPIGADVDLTNFDDMPLNVRRIRESRMIITLPPEAAIINVVLWCAAWHQVPAGSLPNDDIELAQLAGFGRAVSEWQRVREAGALYGFDECNDGRLYHRVVAEVAKVAWGRKMRHEYEKACDRCRKENKRRSDTGAKLIEVPAFNLWLDLGRPDFSAGNLSDSDGKPIASAGNSKTSGVFPLEKSLKGKERKGEERNGTESKVFREKQVRVEQPLHTFSTFMTNCQIAGIAPVAEDDPVFTYADSVGLSRDLVELAWGKFKAKYGSGSDAAKKYRDWRATFRNAVRDNWFKYWATDTDGKVYVTSNGRLAQKEQSVSLKSGREVIV